jgi:hypothetical protein
VTEWHFDCEIRDNERHDYVAAIEKTPEGGLVLIIPAGNGETKKMTFNSLRHLNNYISQIGLEEVELS